VTVAAAATTSAHASEPSPVIPVLDPATGERLGEVPDETEVQAVAKVERADRGLQEWRSVPPRRRAEVLRRCYELMVERSEDLAQLISQENGKALVDARGEVTYAAEFFRWYSEEAVRLNGSVGRAPGGTNNILTWHEPVGVAVLVTPWNFPAAMATRKIAPALAAGCSIVLKPAAETPLTALAIVEICREAGVTENAVNVVTTRRSGAVVAAMLGQRPVRALSFTGSTEVGRRLLSTAAERVLVCSMELGGNAPFLVFDDCDLDDVLDGLMVAKMRNGGQACTAANRILVQRGIHDQVATRLAERMAALKVGRGIELETECGPLINAAAVQKVAGLVEEAQRAGADVLTGGSAPARPGSFFTPTVLTGVAADWRVAREEIFGPVAALQVFETEDEAIVSANSTELGLGAYVYSGDLARGLRVAGHLESGMVAINRGLLSDPAAPFGGSKQSGLGREGGSAGVHEFTETKYVAVDW